MRVNKFLPKLTEESLYMAQMNTKNILRLHNFYITFSTSNVSASLVQKPAHLNSLNYFFSWKHFRKRCLQENTEHKDVRAHTEASLVCRQKMWMCRYIGGNLFADTFARRILPKQFSTIYTHSAGLCVWARARDLRGTNKSTSSLMHAAFIRRHNGVSHCCRAAQWLKLFASIHIHCSPAHNANACCAKRTYIYTTHIYIIRLCVRLGLRVIFMHAALAAHSRSPLARLQVGRLKRCSCARSTLALILEKKCHKQWAFNPKSKRQHRPVWQQRLEVFICFCAQDSSWSPSPSTYFKNFSNLILNPIFIERLHTNLI